MTSTSEASAMNGASACGWMRTSVDGTTVMPGPSANSPAVEMHPDTRRRAGVQGRPSPLAACATVTPSRRRAFTSNGACIVGGAAHRGASDRRDRGNRQPEIRAETDVDGAAVIGRTDADDRHRHAFDPDDASDDRWVRAEHVWSTPDTRGRRRAARRAVLPSRRTSGRATAAVPARRDTSRSRTRPPHRGRRRRGDSGRGSGCWRPSSPRRRRCTPRSRMYAAYEVTTSGLPARSF